MWIGVGLTIKGYEAFVKGSGCAERVRIHGGTSPELRVSAMSTEKIDIPGLLSRMPLFSALSPEDLTVMAAATRERRLQKGDRLFQRGDQPKGFFLVVWGQIKLAFTSAQGNEKVVEILGPLQSFGEAVMFLDQPYPVLGEALADTLVLHIGSAAVFGQIEQDARFARKLLAGMSIRLHTMVRDVESYALRSSTQRVIGYLLQLAESVPCAPKGEHAVELPTSKQVIASRLSLTPETLSRIFHELSDAGLISVHGKQIVIHDAARLAEHD
jgi:CRP/FNR family transcriptional regulator, dissimilatory nitrate respiration regulator